ncbi:MAG: long-chain fatty acid--CoA ligase [Deltaproteobacteria bacterium]|nr:long-chain fatty acid--CoA ligase [Deltaproteobacteria bacterium]
MGDYTDLFEAFRARAEAHPERTAIHYLGTKFSYGRILRDALAFAGSLQAMGVGPDDRVMLYLPNCPQFIIAWLGTLARGAAVTPIAPIYTTRDLVYIAKDTGAAAVVCMDTNYGYVAEAVAEGAGFKPIYTNLVDLLPWWKRAFGHLYDRVPTGRVDKGVAATPFLRCLKAAPFKGGDFQRSGGRLAEILYTGGTTKHPKGVPLSHHVLLEAAGVHAKWAEKLMPAGSNVVIQGAPLFHVLGQVFGFGALCTQGDAVVLLPKVNTDALMDAVARLKATSFFAVPVMYRMLLEHDRLDQYDLSSLKFCFSGGDVLPVDVGRRWAERFKTPICQGYGATETVGGVCLSPVDSPVPPTSMGVLLPNKRVKIVDGDTLDEVPDGEAGEFLVGSDPMVDAYWNKPEETAESFVEIEGKRWYRTGDIVKRDDKGFYYFVDRTADTIKHKGYRVSASEIEAVLQEHPAVVAACAVGVADAKVGERIKALVVLKGDVKGISGNDLTRWCRERLASYKVPQYIEFRDMLPKSKVGKLLRREVRGEEKKRREKGKWEAAAGD